MRVLNFIAYSLVAAHAIETDPVNLLQTVAVRVHKHGRHNATQNPGDPVKRERKMCPHEIQALKNAQGSPFGCRGKLQAPQNKECSFWGEPHVSATFPSQIAVAGDSLIGKDPFDVLYKPGLFRMARAKDKSWEIQTYNCGIYASAVVARFGQDIIEFIGTTGKKNGGVEIYLNGKKQDGNFPLENENKIFIDNKHKIARDNNNQLGGGNTLGGACVDDGNSGQVYMEVAAGDQKNLNVLIRAAQDSWDGETNSFCSQVLTPEQMKYDNWNLEQMTQDESLFTVGQKACEICTTMKWWRQGGERFDGSGSGWCGSRAPKDYKLITIDQTCKSKDLTREQAEEACDHLRDNREFFLDCQLDWCTPDTEGGRQEAVEIAEDELALEHPVPQCVKGECDVAKICCDALKNNHTLELGNVGQNNLCGDGEGATELRYTNVMPANGQQLDLVVKPTGEFKCTNGVTNAKNGVEGKFGVIAIPVGTETEFSFSFVNSGTDTLANVEGLPFSFLDLDQGKKSKQRESVEVCGAAEAVLTSNTELEKSVSGDCIKVTSTTPGKGDDNPLDPEDMSAVQRSRTIAYQTTGASFTAKLGISKSGRQSRKFLFSGHPTTACAEQNDMVGA